MSLTLEEPRDGTIETTGGWPDGLNFRFPRRDLGLAQVLLFVLLVGVLAAIGAIVAGPVVLIVQNGVKLGPVLSLFICGVVVIPLCRFPLWYLLVLLFGHSEIELRAQSLAAGERVGWLRSRKEWPIYRVKRVEVFDLFPKPKAAADVAASLGEPHFEPDPAEQRQSAIGRHLHAFTAVLDDGQRIMLAPAYPQPLLESFTHELSAQITEATKRMFTGLRIGREVTELETMAARLHEGLNLPKAGPAEAEPSGARQLPADFNFRGLTIVERLRVAGLSEEFATAAERGDRPAMLALLERVQLPSAGAAAFADQVLEHFRQSES